MFENAEIVKTGKFKYDIKWCTVKIIKWNVLYGSGDYEDEEDICNDKEIECFYIQYGNPVEQDNFSIGNGSANIEDLLVEAKKYNVIWDDMINIEE